jgi:FHA domain-containing protein/type VI secretion system protein
LLEGLGLEASRPPNLPEPEFARLIGEMLRESLRGTMAVLRARSMTKREARLDTTMIVARDNNPLKFFPDVDSALAQMLTGRSAPSRTSRHTNSPCSPACARRSRTCSAVSIPR